jgi:peptidoglycan/LPS O-acetylase OafA/YrhL
MRMGQINNSHSSLQGSALAHPQYRADIDGLRALAVLSVLGFHAFPSLFPGGFIGVDVFFVISGFLISSIIFLNLETKTFSFWGFYARRIRRIYPALLLILLFSFVLGWFILLTDEYKQLGKHIAAGAGFASNFVLWGESGYFDNAAETKPLLHLWSLGIEEQFYIFWPLMAWFVYKRKAGLVIVLSLLAFSFLANLYLVPKDAIATFYSPLTRAWELLVGSLLAMYLLRASAMKPALTANSGHFLSISGFFLLGIGFALINRQALFPGMWAALPVIGASLLLLAGPNAWLNQKLLANRIAVWFGLISFPLYLWHWPLFSFARIYMGQELTVSLRVGLLLLSTLLAYLTYRFWEKPLRGKGKKVTLFLLFSVLIIGALGVNIYQRNGLGFRYKNLIEVDATVTRDLTKWEHKGMYPRGNCDPGFIYPEAHLCAQTIPNALPDMAVFGDSHAFSAYWGISKAYAPTGHNVMLLGRGEGCLPLTQYGEAKCQETIQHQIDWLTQSKHIHTLFITHRNHIHPNTPESELQAFEKAMRRSFDVFLSSGKKIIYIVSIPEARIEPKLCVGSMPSGRKIDRQNCSFPAEREVNHQRNYRSILKNLMTDYPNIIFFDPITYLCEQEKCEIPHKGIVLWHDDNHLSESGSNKLGQAIAEKLKK